MSLVSASVMLIELFRVTLAGSPAILAVMPVIKDCPVSVRLEGILPATRLGGVIPVTTGAGLTTRRVSVKSESNAPWEASVFFILNRNVPMPVTAKVEDSCCRSTYICGSSRLLSFTTTRREGAKKLLPVAVIVWSKAVPFQTSERGVMELRVG